MPSVFSSILSNFDSYYYLFGDLVNGFEEGFAATQFSECIPRDNEEFKTMFSRIVGRAL